MEQKYYYGNAISEYGMQKGYVDYATLSKCFDAVLNNDIMSLTYGSNNTNKLSPQEPVGHIIAYLCFIYSIS